MENSHLSRYRRYFIAATLGAILLFFLCLTPTNVLANTVTIHDQSHVLNAAQVQDTAAKTTVPLFIYTTNTFHGDQNTLDQDARAHLPSQHAIAIGIDTVQRHLSIQSGDSVHLSDSQASDAVTAFQNNFNNGDYTGATIAAITSIQGALTGDSGSMTSAGVIVAILLGIIAIPVIIIIFVALSRNRRRPPMGGGWRGGRGYYPGTYYPGTYGSSVPPATSSGGFGGGAGGSFGGGSTGGGAGGSF